MKKSQYSTAARTYNENGITGIRRVVGGRPQPTDAEINAAVDKFNATIKEMWGEDATMEQYYEEHRYEQSPYGDFKIGSLMDRHARSNLHKANK